MTTCASCPFRRSAPPTWDHDELRGLFSNCQDDGSAFMICHKTKRRWCRGWLRVLGFEAVGVRLLALFGEVKPEDIGNPGPELYASFDEMMAANGVELPARNRVRE